MKLHGSSGLILDAAGELSADRYGVWSGRVRFKFPAGRWEMIPAGNSGHPYANWATGEKQTVLFTPGLWTLVMEFAGTPVQVTEPVYETRFGTGQEPIESHDRFVSHIAGTPSSPKNGALFVDEEGLPTADNDRGIFHGFRVTIDNAKNPFAGQSSYLALNNTLFTKSWTQRSAPNSGNAGKISAPPSQAPNLPNGMNWLNLGVSFTQRGACYTATESWMASGRGGWNPVVYS